MARYLHIQIYEEEGTSTNILYDNKVDTDWGITSGTASLDSILMEEELDFAQINASMFQVQVFGIDADVSNKKIRVSIIESTYGLTHLRTDVDIHIYIPGVIDVDGYEAFVDSAQPQNWIMATEGTVEQEVFLFTGTIESCKQDNAGIYRDIVAYDWIKWHREDDVASWFSNFMSMCGTSTVQLSVLRDSLLTYMGLNIPTDTFDNDDLVIDPAMIFVPASITFETVINLISVLQNFCFHIDGNGNAEYITLSNTVAHTITPTLIEGENCEWENYTTNEITGVAVYDTADNFVQLVGTDANPYKIVGNIFLLGMSAEDIDIYCGNILDTLSQIQYVPCAIKMIESDLSFKLGDYVETDKGNTYILQNSLNNVWFIDQTITAPAHGADLNPEIKNYNQSLIEGAKISRIEQTIDSITTEVADLTREVSSQITQQADKLVLQVNNGGVITSLTMGSIVGGGTQNPIFQVSAENIDFIANDSIQLTANSIGIVSTNFSVTPAGEITSVAGHIGGFDITSDALYSRYTNGNDYYEARMQSFTGTSTDRTAFRIQNRISGTLTTPFYVTYGGKLYAENVDISGKVSATSGKIGPWSFGSQDFYSEYISGNDRYRVTIRGITAGDTETQSALFLTRVKNGATSYPIDITYDGKLKASNVELTGDITAKNITVWDEIKLVSDYHGGTAYTLIATGSGGPDSIYTRIYNGLGQARITLIDQDTGDWNGYAGYFSGGTWYFNSELEVANTITTKRQVILKPNATIGNTGVEIYGSSPFIDFHNSYNDTSDYTARIIHITSGNNKYIDFWESSSAWITCRALSFANQSSKYVKKNIKSIEDEEAKKILELRPVKFDYKYGGAENQRGLIAEEVAEIMPEMVIGELNKIDKSNLKDTPSIDYSKFVPYLIKMIQIQQKEIDALKNKDV